MQSCEKDKTVDPIGQVDPVEQIDKTEEITVSSGIITINNSKEPTIIKEDGFFTDAAGNKIPGQYTYYVLDDRGDAYSFRIDADVKLLSKVDISKLGKPVIKIFVGGEQIAQLPVEITYLTNPDLNKNGKTENNEKYYKVKIRNAQLGSSIINMKKAYDLIGRNLAAEGYRIQNPDGTRNLDNPRTGSIITISSIFTDKTISKTEL